MKTVNESINLKFWEAMNGPERALVTVGSIENDCVVGEAVVELLNDIEKMATKVYARDGGAIEPDLVACMKALAYNQIRVWYFG